MSYIIQILFNILKYIKPWYSHTEYENTGILDSAKAKERTIIPLKMFYHKKHR